MEGAVKFTMDRAQATAYNQRRAETTKVSVLARHHQGVSFCPSLIPPFSYRTLFTLSSYSPLYVPPILPLFLGQDACFMQMHTVGWLVSTGGALSAMVAVRSQQPRKAPATDG